MEKSEILKLITSNSPRVSFQENDGASSSAWNNYVLVVVDGTFAKYIKCLKCDAVLKWKHRDGTSGLINHAKSCGKNAAAGARNRTLTDLAGFSMLAKPDAVIPTSVKSSVADAVVMMCASDIRYTLIAVLFMCHLLCFHFLISKRKIGQHKAGL